MPMTFTVVGMTASSDVDVSFAGDDLVFRLASSAYLARFTGTSRVHTESDLPQPRFSVTETTHSQSPLPSTHIRSGFQSPRSSRRISKIRALVDSSSRNSTRSRLSGSVVQAAAGSRDEPTVN